MIYEIINTLFLQRTIFETIQTVDLYPHWIAEHVGYKTGVDN